MLGRFSRLRRRSDTAHALYSAAVEQARLPGFYGLCAVPDTLDGRFDMIVLHTFLVMRRLKSDAGEGARLAQAVFDVMFGDFDQNLRELGVGDLGVGRRVKAMARGFYGRVKAYEDGLEASAPGPLRASLRRNLYGTVEVADGPLGAMAEYVRAATRDLDAQPVADLLAGRVRFPAAPGDGA